MFGDTDTVSEKTKSDGGGASEPRSGWSTAPAQSPEPAPEWSQDWSTAAEPASASLPWEAAAYTAESTSEPAVFAGWGALSSTDSPALTDDLSSWDSPTDAVIAQTSPAPWAVETGAESPQRSALPDWGTPVGTVTDAPGTSAEDLVEAWAEPAGSAESLADVRPLGRKAHYDFVQRPDDEHVEPSAPDIWADAPPAPTLPASFLSGTVTSEADTSGAPFHEIAAALASADAVPLAARTTSTPIATLATEAGDASTATTTTTITTNANTTDAPVKRRGRLAARTARETLAKNADDLTDRAASPVGEPDIADEATAAPLRAKTKGKFFAKKDPGELAVEGASRETPKILRIAALVSLLVGVGLFAFTVVNSRSSDSGPDIAPTVPAVPATTPSVPAPPANASTAPGADPIFGAEAPADEDLSFSDPGDFSS